MDLKNRKKRKPKTISEMTNSRGTLPPPQRADENRKYKSDRHEVRRKLKRGDYDA